MPRSTREWALRELNNARGNIDWAGRHLYLVVNRYEEEHPEISEPIRAILAALLELDKATAAVRKLF